MTPQAISPPASSPVIPAPTKPQVLARLGAEVVAADVDDTESLKRAFQGAYGAFCVTFFWNHFSPRKGTRECQKHGRDGHGTSDVSWASRPVIRQWSGPNRVPLGGRKSLLTHFES